MLADLAVSADGERKFPIRQHWELSLPHRKCLLHSGLPQTTDRKKQPNPGFEKHLIFGPSLP